jgi:hypothetical protein
MTPPSRLRHGFFTVADIARALRLNLPALARRPLSFQRPPTNWTRERRQLAPPGVRSSLSESVNPLHGHHEAQAGPVLSDAAPRRAF